MEETPSTKTGIIYEFVIHIFIGTVAFIAIAFSAIAVGWMANYLISIQFPSFLTKALIIVKYVIFTIDLILFLVFILRLVFRMGRRGRNA